MAPSAKKQKRDCDVVFTMCGLPGAMGQAVSKACLDRGFEIADVALTGPNMPEKCTVTPSDGVERSVRLLGPSLGESETLTLMTAAKDAAAAKGKVLIAVDFTHPTAVNRNADVYNKTQIPFVMGTTGGDRDKLLRTTADSGTYAVIAPNMCKQIVAFQAMFEYMAKEFPGAFGSYSLDVVESHQSGKADTSGTAKDVVSSLNAIKGGEPLKVEEIKKIREPDAQVAFGVPKDALRGHAWHTYTLTSPDASVQFQFKHNVNGRSTYAEGVADAVSFLRARMKESSERRVFDMVAVLQGGAMK